MRLCSGYHVPIALWAQLDELRFSERSLTQGLSFAGEHPDKKVIIEIPNLNSSKISIEQWLSLLEENNNLYLDFYNIDDMIHNKWPADRYMYHYPITTYNMLYFVLNWSVSDIVIGEPLVFDLPKVREIANQNERNICVRANPTIGRPTLFNAISMVDSGIKHFFILPQHVKVYEPYIDVLDILDDNVEREETLVRLYLKGIYKAALKYFVKNCECEIGAELLTDDFVYKRVKCHQNCMQSQDGRNCHYCEAETALFERLAQYKFDHGSFPAGLSQSES